MRSTGDEMIKLPVILFLLATPAFAQTPPSVKEPVCEPIGRTSKGDLVFSMECRNIPGLPIGDRPVGYNPTPVIKDVTVPLAPPAAPESK
jgi:hypothetical protein